MKLCFDGLEKKYLDKLIYLKFVKLKKNKKLYLNSLKKKKKKKKKT
jgi:hypothetical protein